MSAVDAGRAEPDRNLEPEAAPDDSDPLSSVHHDLQALDDDTSDSEDDSADSEDDIAHSWDDSANSRDDSVDVDDQTDEIQETTVGFDAPSGPEYERIDCTSGDPAVLAGAAESVRLAMEQGQLVVLPTDTVYGIGADAFSPDAVQRLLDAKVRGRDMPPPVLIADASLLRVLALEASQQAKDLVARHWPGPLTVIFHVQPSLRLDLGETEGTIALRVPDHDLAREILRGTGPMAVSSANISGLTAAVTVDEAIDQLGDNVAIYLDGGPLAADGAPSTIVDFSQTDDGEVLRHGALSVEVLRETVPGLVDLVDPDNNPVATEGHTDADADGPEPDGHGEDDAEPDPGPSYRQPATVGDDTDPHAVPAPDDPTHRSTEV